MRVLKNQAKYVYFSRFVRFGLFLVFVAVFSSPLRAEASIFSAVARFFSSAGTTSEITRETRTSQTFPLLEAAINIDPNPAKGGGDITVVDGSALLSELGPSGSIADIELKDHQGEVSTYVVHKGDTLSQVSQMFKVSVNTIVWANDLDRNVPLREGQTLVVLPVNGVQYIVQKGDVLGDIVKKFHANSDDVISFNNLGANQVLSVGQTIIIPDGVESASRNSSNVTPPSRASTPSYSGYYTNPVPSGHKTQGLHGYAHNSIDIGAPTGTSVFAAADGVVIVSQFRPLENPWFGGYGNNIMIKHPNGTLTRYGHMSAVYVSEGARVNKGQVIGEVGSTGDSSGPHLHFEIRGARNPF